MQAMSDFELHTLCVKYPVLFILILENTKVSP